MLYNQPNIFRSENVGYINITQCFKMTLHNILCDIKKNYITFPFIENLLESFMLCFLEIQYLTVINVFILFKGFKMCCK